MFSNVIHYFRGTLLCISIAAHTASLGNASFAKHLVSGVWRSVCTACGLRCAFPPLSRATEAVPAEVPVGTELAVLALHHHQVPDLDGITPELLGSRTARAGARADDHATPLPIGRLLHFVVDFGDVLGEATPGRARSGGGAPTLAAPSRVQGSWAGDHESSAAPHGILGTRMMLRATSRPTFSAPPIVELCQNRSLWRGALRFLSVRSNALPELWRRLSHDWPALFHCGEPTTAS